MSQADQNKRIDYIEFSATNVEETKKFYSDVFGWVFTDYGPDYTSFTDGRMGGGFHKATEVSAGGPLVVLYAANLETIAASVIKSGGRVVRETFDFPGGDGVFTLPIQAGMSWRSGQNDFEPFS